MDSQAQDGNLCRWRDLVGVDFGAQNEPKIVFVQACKSKLISRWFWDRFVTDFPLIWTPFFLVFGLASVGNLRNWQIKHIQRNLQKNHQFFNDFAKSILIFESHKWLIIDVLMSLRTFSYFKPSWDQILMSFWKPLGLHFDLPNQSGPWLEQKVKKWSKWTHPKGGSGGARPLIGGNPHLGLLGQAAWGLSPVGVCWYLSIRKHTLHYMLKNILGNKSIFLLFS